MFATIKYSGLITKTKALSARLLSDSDYSKIIAMDSVPEIIAYLREHPGYKDIFAYTDDDISHRGQLEHILAYSLYRDYLKLYKFADNKSRNYLYILSKKIEVSLLKSSLRSIYSNEELPRYASMLSYLEKHSKIKMEVLYNATSLSEFVAGLKNTSYYPLLSRIDLNGQNAFFEIENCLDQCFFSYAWSAKDKLLSKEDAKAFTRLLGTEIDLLNINWVYRCKKYFKIDTPSLYGMVIPISYKLKKSELTNLIESQTTDEFAAILKHTVYDTEKSPFDLIHPEQTFNAKLRDIYASETKKAPISMSVIANFIYQRDRELDTITTAVECIRYKFPSNQTTTYLLRCKPELVLK